MKNHSYLIDHSLKDFILRPLWVIFIAPFFILSLIVPKISSESIVNMATEEVKDNLNERGGFRKVNGIIWMAFRNLYLYIINTPFYLMPIVTLVGMSYAIIFMVLGTIFTLLMPLDWISSVVETIRQWIVKFVNKRQENIKYNIKSFLFTPIVLAFLTPIFLLVIFIPKITSQIIDTDI